MFYLFIFFFVVVVVFFLLGRGEGGGVFACLFFFRLSVSHVHLHLYPFLIHVVFITRIVICVLYYSIEGFAGVSYITRFLSSVYIKRHVE